jgi:hypothetical protein
MSCPLYKSLKSNGTSFYAFPSSAEDISAAYQNGNYKMYFSKYTLLNFPKQQTDGGTNSVYWDFSTAFETSSYTTPATDYRDQLVESLRNYVANQEVTIKDSRKNNTEYYYDNNVLTTTTEKVFFKWCKKLGLIDFEQATPGDEYFSDLPEFERNNLSDDLYFPEYLWRERQVVDWSTVSFNTDTTGNFLTAEFLSLTNFRVGDLVEANITNSIVIGSIGSVVRGKVTEIIAPTSTSGQKIVTDISFSGGSGPYADTDGSVTLVYNRLVQYIGEVNGINNVQESNRSYTEVYAHVPDHTGQTPDILFRTGYDSNYKPNLVFPILPSQYQPEIKGAELFTSPIVSNPSAYPGGYYGQFDTQDYTYETGTGDSVKRSGDYFGINGDINSVVVQYDDTNGISTVDGIGIDFDTTHYVKMNISGRETITNFDQFNALEVNNEPPKDFDFNAILWYYTVEDLNGNSVENLYGISFVDNPNNNPVPEETGKRVPTFTKLVATDTQDGTSYAFSLNLSFNIVNDNPQDAYNPQAINSLFSFNLFNTAMSRLANANQSFEQVINMQNSLNREISEMRQLLYSQTDIQSVNKRITYLETLLKLYSSLQIVDSETITVSLDQSTNPPRLSLRNVDATYNSVYTALTSNMYTTSGTAPYVATVPENKSFLINVVNNDTTTLTLPNNQNLSVVIDRDLDYKQSVDIVVDATDTATQNKKLDVYIRYSYITSENNPVETRLLETVDLPIYYNSVSGTPNSARRSERFGFDIDLSRDLTLKTGGILSVPLSGVGKLVSNSVQRGDTLMFRDFFVGTSSQYNFSGQYPVSSVGSTNSYVDLNVSGNQNLVNYGLSSSLPLTFNSSANYVLSNVPHLELNKGFRIRITRVSEGDAVPIQERYLIQRF